jgi:hypothetical protein
VAEHHFHKKYKHSEVIIFIFRTVIAFFNSLNTHIERYLPIQQQEYYLQSAATAILLNAAIQIFSWKLLLQLIPGSG